jgi:hypothetical protein
MTENLVKTYYLGSSVLLALSGLGFPTDLTHLRYFLEEIVAKIEPHIQPADDQHGGGQASTWHLQYYERE